MKTVAASPVVGTVAELLAEVMGMPRWAGEDHRSSYEAKAARFLQRSRECGIEIRMDGINDPGDRWKPIEQPPSAPMPVLLFFGHPHYREKLEILETEEPYRREDIHIGFFDGKTFVENGTGHDAYEGWWMEQWMAPTHWAPVEPPITSSPTP